MKDFVIWIASISFFAVLGGTAKYIHDLGRDNQSFHFKKWLASCFIGVVIAIIAGLIGKHLALSEHLIYAVVGISSISAKELIGIIPKLATEFLSKKANQKNTKK